ncbi:hypothetical protein HHI36_005394 [Cryptolaemus montrouzieri]|uniref:Protein takeout n=1 Tax=Cryptolaemus montrouzieri TaxID=559131 RepID=A0ABD2NVJ7_9CUCU
MTRLLVLSDIQTNRGCLGQSKRFFARCFSAPNQKTCSARVYTQTKRNSWGKIKIDGLLFPPIRSEYNDAFSSSLKCKSKLPTFLKTCRRSDPNLEECIKESVQRLKPLLAHGISEFDIPSCEPLYIPEVVLDQGTGAVSVKSSYKDIKVYGPSDFTLQQVKINLNKDRIRLKVHVPSLYLVSKYTMEGRILMMPIMGSGNCYGNYSDIDATVSIQGQKINKDNETYFNVKEFYVDFNIGHASIKLENLFNGDKELGEAMNLFLNDNWKNVANEIKPVLEDTIAGIFKKFSNKIYHKYPLSVLLPK